MASKPVGITFQNPLLVRLCMDETEFHTTLVTRKSRVDQVRAARRAIASEDPRLKVAVVMSCSILDNSSMRRALCRFDRLLCLDTPTALKEYGFRVCNLQSAGRGVWSMQQVDTEFLVRELTPDQSLGYLLTFKPKKSALSLGRTTFRSALELLKTTSEHAAPEDVEKFLAGAALYAGGFRSASAYREFAKQAVADGVDAVLVPRLTRYLKRNATKIKKVLPFFHHYRVSAVVLVKTIGPAALDLEAVEGLLVEMGERISRPRETSVPKDLREHIGSRDRVDTKAALIKVITETTGRLCTSLDTDKIAKLRAANLEGVLRAS